MADRLNGVLYIQSRGYTYSQGFGWLPVPTGSEIGQERFHPIYETIPTLLSAANSVTIIAYRTRTHPGDLFHIEVSNLETSSRQDILGRPIVNGYHIATNDGSTLKRLTVTALRDLNHIESILDKKIVRDDDHESGFNCNDPEDLITELLGQSITVMSNEPLPDEVERILEDTENNRSKIVKQLVVQDLNHKRPWWGKGGGDSADKNIVFVFAPRIFESRFTLDDEPMFALWYQEDKDPLPIAEQEVHRTSNTELRPPKSEEENPITVHITERSSSVSSTHQGELPTDDTLASSVEVNSEYESADASSEMLYGVQQKSPQQPANSEIDLVEHTVTTQSQQGVTKYIASIKGSSEQHILGEELNCLTKCRVQKTAFEKVDFRDHNFSQWDWGFGQSQEITELSPTKSTRLYYVLHNIYGLDTISEMPTNGSDFEAILRNISVRKSEYNVQIHREYAVVFQDCDLRGANLRGIIAVHLQFKKCVIQDADFTGSLLIASNFQDCDGKPVLPDYLQKE